MQGLIKTWLVVLTAIAAIAGGLVWWFFFHGKVQSVSYRTAEIQRGNLVASIAATGTVEPEEVIDVGAQVAGQINEFGKDDSGKSVDYNSTVEEGTVLARIDDSLYTADVALANAQLAQAKAGQIRAEADLVQLKAKQEQARRDWERARKLGPSEALASTAYDAYKAGFDIAQANVAVGEAAVTQAKASVAQAQAALDRAQRNLSYCTIKAPVKGVIIDRRVNIGQTVVASLNAPSLFLIAKDLKRMQVWVAVNEADVGRLYQGMPVNFTVDAIPERTFDGQVGKIRLNATMTQNVVTYTVEVNTDNSDGALKPYLTANVKFITGQRVNVLLVPNAALRWTPRPEQVAPEYREYLSGPRNRRQTASQPHTQAATQPATAAYSHGILWTPEGQSLRPVKVRVGISDGLLTEVQGDGLEEGLPVVIGEQRHAADETTKESGTSPFVPQFRNRSRNQPQRAP